MKKFLVILVSIVMVSAALMVVPAFRNGVVNAVKSPSFPVSPIVPLASPSVVNTTAYANGTFSGYENYGYLTSGNATVKAAKNVSAQTLFLNDTLPTWRSFIFGSSWGQGYSTNISLGAYQVYGNTAANITLSIASPYDPLNNTYLLNEVLIEVYNASRVDTAGSGAPFYSWSPATKHGTGRPAILVSASLSQLSYSFYGGLNLYIILYTNLSYYSMQLGGGNVSTWLNMGKTLPELSSTYPTPASIPFVQGWDYSGVGSGGVSWSLPSGSVSEAVQYSSPYSVKMVSTGYNPPAYTANTVYFDPVVSWVDFENVQGNPNVPEFNVSWLVTSVVVSVTSSVYSYSSSYSITENVNWFNGSMTFTIGDPPSGWLNGSSLNGKTWPTVFDFSVNHLYVSNLGSPYLEFNVSGHNSVFQFTPTTQYVDVFTGTNDQVTDNSGGISVSYTTHDLANGYPSVVSYGISQRTVNPGQPVNFYVNSSEPFASEPDHKVIGFGDGDVLTTSPSATLSTVVTHSYASAGTYTPTFYVQNDPNAALGSLKTSLKSMPSITVKLITLTANPPAYTVLGKNATLTLKWVTAPGNPVQQITLKINHALVDTFTVSGTTGEVSYDYIQAVSIPSTIQWNLHALYGSQSLTVQYSSDTTPTANSSSVIAMEAQYASHAYPLYISGAPGGTGYYQQFFNISDPSSYGINANGSNIQFALTNGSLLYAWIQSINSSVMDVWVKVPNGTSQIDMEVFPQFENLFNRDGYLGEAPYLSGTALPGLPSTYDYYWVMASKSWSSTNIPDYTLNISFDPSLISGYLNSNLSNVKVFLQLSPSSPLVPLETKNLTTLSNTATSVTVSINTTLAPYNGTWQGGVAFIFAVAPVGDQVNYWNSNFNFTPRTSIAFSFLPFQKNSGTYAEYDNGRFVFNHYENFTYKNQYWTYSGGPGGGVQSFGWFASGHYLKEAGAADLQTYSPELFPDTGVISLTSTQSFRYVPLALFNNSEKVPAKNSHYLYGNETGFYTVTNDTIAPYSVVNGTAPTFGANFSIPSGYSTLSHAFNHQVTLNTWEGAWASGINSYFILWDGKKANLYFRGSLIGSENFSYGRAYGVVGENISWFAYTYVYATFYSDGTMPSFSVGASSPFFGNVSASAVVSGIETQHYNSTFSIYQYNIPLSPTANYVQINFNDTWIFYSGFPNTYVVNYTDHRVVFENISGYTSIQINFIQPSSQIGEPSTISIQPYQGSVLLTMPLSYSVRYTPFLTSTTYQFWSDTPFFTVPFGSKMTVTVYDQWNESVGRIVNHLVASASSVIPVQLNVTRVHIDFTNQTGLQVYFERNGINVSAFGYTIYLANNSLYRWTTSVYSALKGKMVNYTGTLATDKPEMTLIISTNPAPASYTIEAFGYPGSSVGQFLNSGPATGNPNVTLTVNGHKESLNTQYQSTVGTTLNIVITDPLGQVLLETNVTLLQTGNVISLTIQKPSYIFGLINEETVPASSPLATQWNNLSVQNSTRHFNFTTSVNQESEVYLLGGENYTMFTHDNVTDTINFTLDQNVFYIIHGQNITRATTQQIEKYITEQAGKGALTIQPVVTPIQALVHDRLYFSFNVFYSNGTELNQTELQQTSKLAMVINQSSLNYTSSLYLASFAVNPTVPQFSVSGDYLNVSFTMENVGYFTFFLKLISGNSTGVFSSVFHSYSITNQSVNMELSVSGPASFEKNTTAYYVAAVAYGNGTLFNATDTGLALKNMQVQLFRNGQFFSLETPYYIQPGKIGIKLNLSQIGSNYVLDVLVTTFSLNGHNTSAQATTSFSVLAYNPNTNFWDSLLNGIAGGFYKVSLYLGIIVTIIAFVLYVYRFVTRKKRELKKQARRVQADLVAEAMYGSLSEQEKKRIIMDYQRKHSGILHRWKMDLVKGFDKLHKKRGE